MVFGIGRCFDGDVGKLALCGRVLARQVGGITTFAPGQVTGALRLVGMTLPACPLCPFSQGAGLGVALRGRRPGYFVC